MTLHGHATKRRKFSRLPCVALQYGISYALERHLRGQKHTPRQLPKPKVRVRLHACVRLCVPTSRPGLGRTLVETMHHACIIISLVVFTYTCLYGKRIDMFFSCIRPMQRMVSPRRPLAQCTSCIEWRYNSKSRPTRSMAPNRKMTQSKPCHVLMKITFVMYCCKVISQARVLFAEIRAGLMYDVLDSGIRSCGTLLIRTTTYW